MDTPKIKPETPLTDAFRRWLSAALTATGHKPATIARVIDASPNSVGRFLNSPSCDITLSRAATLERALRRIAAEKGEQLPEINFQPASEGRA